jgi:DNA-binding CsgD family transcriptional regulator
MADAVAGVSAAIRRACSHQVESRALRAEVVRVLGRHLPVDAYAFVLTDPETSVGVDPLASIPDLGALPRLIALRYTTLTQRWTTIAHPVSLAGTPAAAHGPWQEYLLAHGVVDVATVALRDRHGCWGFVDLWSMSRPYADAELSLLGDLTEVLTSTVRRCQASTFTRDAAPGDVPSPDAPDGPAVVLLDSTPERGLVITGATPGTHAWLARLLPPETGHAPVPAAVVNVAAQLLAREAGVDAAPALGRVHVADTVWLRLRASRLAPSGEIAVSIELAAPADRVEMFARSHGLSPREQQVVHVLTEGGDTAELAARLFISPHTVQDHLKSIFAKAGVHHRSALLGRVLGANPLAP